jgi:activator of HSP90 ATPase
VEKDALEWSRSRLSELLAGVTLADADGVTVRTTALQTCTGEAYVNRRKGKIIAGYELDVKFGWEGTAAGGATARGTLHLPYIADENADDDDLEVRIAAEGDGEADRACKAAALKHGVPVVRAAVKLWVAEMAAGGPGGAGPSEAPAAGAAAGGSGAAAAAAAPKPAAAAAPKPLPRREEGPGDTHTIRMTEKFYCRPSDIFEALTHPGRVRAFTQSDADVSDAPGAPFTLFSGNIHGTNEEMEPGARIVQRWRFRNWPDDVFSRVVITLREPEYGTTMLELEQSGVPSRDRFGNETVLDTTESGWKLNFWDRIRKVFGYGC